MNEPSPEMMPSLNHDLRAVWRARVLLRLMTRREIAARFTGSSLGLIWLYAQPLLTLAALYLVFDVALKARLGAGAPIHSVGLFLIAGMAPWMAFAEAMSRTMASLIEAGGILQKNPLPPALFPARAVWVAMVTYLPLLFGVALFYAFMQGVTWAWLVLPIWLAAVFALAFVLGYVAALLAAALRDVQQGVVFLLSLGAFLSPVMFPMASLPEGLRELLWLNPMTPVVLGIQAILLTGAWPPLNAWIGLLVWLVLGSWVLNSLIARSRDHLIDWL